MFEKFRGLISTMKTPFDEKDTIASDVAGDMRFILTQGLDQFNPPAFYTEHGYTNIRIPGIVALDSGRLLCCYECRRGGDWSSIDVGMQIRDDGGKT